MMHVHRKLGLILQFGGHVELDETPWQAILHELVEETGYQPEQLQLLQPKNRLTMSDPNSNTVVHPYPVTVQTHPFGDKPHRHTDISYAFVTSEEPRNAPHEGEATNFIFFTAEELATSTDPKLLQDNRDIFGFVFQHCLPEWERVALSEFRTT
jgi:8-oxo-dGTP pyrophosphatase MutT (NUDIX family)